MSLSLQGDKELIKKLKKLEGKELKKKIRKATRAGVKEILPTAKALAPVETGQLRSALKVRSLKRSRVAQGHQVQIDTKRNPDAYYGSFQEYGTKNLEAKEFLKKAADQQGQKALDTTMDGIVKGIKELT